MSDKSMKFRINGENLRREIEAVRTLNIVHEPLRELLDQILADHSVSPRSISARSVPPRTPDEVAAEVAAIERANADRLERRYAAFNQPVPLDRGPKPEMSGPKLQDRQIAAQGRWAIATDGAQWILQRRRGDRWQNLSFVRTTRDILARCLREKGAQPDALATRLPARRSCFRSGQ